MSGSRKYAAELRAVRMVAEVRGEYASEWAAIVSVAAKLGIGTPQTLLSWVRRDQIDSGARPGVTSEMAEELTGNFYDNALAETINGLHKSELIKVQGPWRTVDQVEVATLEWVDWFNHCRDDSGEIQ